MTQSTQPTALSAALAAAPLFLFEVTLAWNYSNADEGDYQSNVWARDEDHAVRELAQEMAEHKHSYCTTDEERARFVQRKVDNAPSHAAIRVASGVMSDCEALLKGPTDVMSAEAAADFAALSAILKKYGAV